MSSRERILSKVRAGVAAGAPVTTAETEAERRRTVAARLAEPPRHLIPSRVTGKSSAELVAGMRRWLELARAEMIEVAGPEQVPATVADFLRRHNQPPRVRIGEESDLAQLPWASQPQIEVVHGKARREDSAGVTRALSAIAETGTLVVPSGPQNPVTLSFLPESNIVIVARGDIVGPLEDAFVLLRTRTAGTMLPRTVNLVSGPSRSADIGGIPVLGAHGPKRLCVIVVG